MEMLPAQKKVEKVVYDALAQKWKNRFAKQMKTDYLLVMAPLDHPKTK